MSDYSTVKLVISDSLHYTSGPSLFLTSETLPGICLRLCCLFLLSFHYYFTKNVNIHKIKFLVPLRFFSAFNILNVIEPQKLLS